MSKWTNATLTADGQNLQAQLLDGGGFEFTKVTAADSSGTDKLTLTMQPSVIAGKTITVPVLLSNSNLSAGFTMNQLKFYARKTGIPAGDEIVYAIAEDETGDEIPSESDSPGFTIDWSYTFQFGNATSVNVSIDPAGLVSMALLGSPGGIATLNNAGAVPIEQGGTGAVTASAALAALGGMRASATGDDIPTSASDPTSISSQLSNRLPLSGGEMTGPISYDNDRHISGGGTSTDFDFHAGKVAIRLSPENAVGNDISRCVNIRDTGTGALYPIATATPPQAENLPLISGFTADSAKFWKTQDGIVFVKITNLRKQDGSSLPFDGQFATLPEDCRPFEDSMYVANISDLAYIIATCSVLVYPNGTVKIAGLHPNYLSNSKTLISNFFFLANR